MKDFVGRTIRIGDTIAYFCSTRNGGLGKYTYVVKDFTEQRLVVYDQRSFSRKKKYLVPQNCVVLTPVQLRTENLIPVEVECSLVDSSTSNWNNRRLREQLSSKIMEKLRSHHCIKCKNENGISTMSVKMLVESEGESG